MLFTCCAVRLGCIHSCLNCITSLQLPSSGEHPSLLVHAHNKHFMPHISCHARITHTQPTVTCTSPLLGTEASTALGVYRHLSHAVCATSSINIRAFFLAQTRDHTLSFLQNRQALLISCLWSFCSPFFLTLFSQISSISRLFRLRAELQGATDKPLETVFVQGVFLGQWVSCSNGLHVCSFPSTPL